MPNFTQSGTLIYSLFYLPFFSRSVAHPSLSLVHFLIQPGTPLYSAWYCTLLYSAWYTPLFSLVLHITLFRLVYPLFSLVHSFLLKYRSFSIPARYESWYTFHYVWVIHSQTCVLYLLIRVDFCLIYSSPVFRISVPVLPFRPSLA